ncbi:MAG: TIGR01244 family sulfur transferase [Alphaproteobacteria bacterium]|nr:TIGR01244 family sulfur transferase [Alphaproteobacteria bacterium]
MEWTFITSEYAVAPQINVEDLQKIVEAGFKSIINNRPDGEEPDQPSSASLEAAVRAQGLEYAYNPVAPSGLSEENIANIKGQMSVLPKPILAFCRTGNRSTILFKNL